MESEAIFCLDCKRKFVDKKSFIEFHSKPSFLVLEKKHRYIEAEDTLNCISKLLEGNIKLNEELQKQQKQIEDLSENIELLNNFTQDIFLECNVYVKNGKTSIQDIGKCLLQFFPKSINFRIECKGDIQNNDKNNFKIEIIFPFRKAQIKQCYIEKILGCVYAQEIKDYDGNNFLICSNYSSFVAQKDSLISIKLLKNYSIPGKYEDKKINVVINGLLTFHSLIVHYDIPCLLFNTYEKKYLSYENFNWKFVDHFIENGNLNENCLISLIIDESDTKNVTVYIKGKNKFVGNKPNYVTSNKNEAELNIVFYNKIYGLVGIYSNDNSLSMEQNGLITFNQNTTLFLVCNI